MRFWVRFYTSSLEDPRPVIHPRPFDWWLTGETFEQAIICGVVDADDEALALVEVKKGWPEVNELDFCEPKPDGWAPQSDRFPPYDTAPGGDR